VKVKPGLWGGRVSGWRFGGSGVGGLVDDGGERGQRGERGEIPFVAMGFWRDIFVGEGRRFEVWRGRALLTIWEEEMELHRGEWTLWLYLAVLLYMSFDRAAR